MVPKILVIFIVGYLSIHNIESKYNIQKILHRYENEFKNIEENAQINRDKSRLENLKFSFSNCGPTTDPLKIKSLTLTPDPLKIPGNVTFSLDASLDTNIKSPLIMNLKIIKIVGPFKVEIPCVDNFGSCTYSDLCSMLPTPDNCPAFFKEHDIPCSCPFPNGEYSAQNVQIGVDVAQKIPTGEYNIIANLQSKETGHVGCIQIDVKLA